VIYKATTKPGVQRSRGAGEQPRLTRSLDLLYHGKRSRIVFLDGSSIEGVVTRYTMYWLEVKLNNGKVVYVNKGSIKLIEPLEEEKGGSSMGGVGNDYSKPK
jgi:hypothetical protein